MTNMRVKRKKNGGKKERGSFPVSEIFEILFHSLYRIERSLYFFLLIIISLIIFSLSSLCVILKLSNIICKLLSFTLEFFTNKIKIPERYDYLILRKIIWFWLFPPTSFGRLQITLSICYIPFWRAQNMNTVWWILYKLLLTARLLDQGLYFVLWSYPEYCLEIS